MFAVRKVMMGGKLPFKFIGSSQGKGSNVASVTCAFPAGSKPGMLAVAICHVGGNLAAGATMLAPSGWGNYIGFIDSGSQPYLFRSCTRVIQAGDTGITFAPSNSGSIPRGITVTILVYQSAKPEGVGENYSATRTNAGTLTVPTRTVIASKAVLLVPLATSNGTYTHGTIPSGMTLDNTQETGIGDGSRLSIYTQDVVAGATGTRTCTVGGLSTGSTSVACSILIVGK